MPVPTLSKQEQKTMRGPQAAKFQSPAGSAAVSRSSSPAPPVFFLGYADFLKWQKALDHEPIARSYFIEQPANFLRVSGHDIELLETSSADTKHLGKEIYLSTRQVNRIKSELLSKGISEQVIRSTFDNSWKRGQMEVGMLQKVTFKDIMGLNERHIKLSIAGTISSASRISITGSRASTSGSASPTPSLSIPALKRMSSTATSTPVSSNESSPEPSSKKAKIKPDAATLLLRETAVLGAKGMDLETSRKLYEKALVSGGAAFLALDIETWERAHDAMLEFGWSFVDFEYRNGKVEVRREDQHVVIKENSHRRNGKFSPDARDHFDFGQSLHLPEQVLYNLLHALLETLSSSTPLFLIFHDPRSDLKSIAQLGFDTKTFIHELRHLGKGKAGVYVVDTQRLYSAWEGVNRQTRLSACCEVLEVPTRRLHNAGNDAHYTLEIFERLMDRSRKSIPAVIKK